MRIVVTGGRTYGNKEQVWKVLDTLRPSYVAQGGASGADTLADLWAKENEIHGVERETFKADWSVGKAAGNIRNGEMLDAAEPDLLVVFKGDIGTNDCVKQALTRGILVMRVEDPKIGGLRKLKY